MREINKKFVKQVDGEANRRWFEDNFFDLMIWEEKNGKIIAFQLSYDKHLNQHAITWNEENGYIHNKVDDGENRDGKYKASPVMLLDGVFDFKTIAEKFKKSSKGIETKISTFVYDKISKYSDKL